MNRLHSILIIDDDETQQLVLEKALTSHLEVQVKRAGTGRDGLLALQMDKDRAIGLVLLDLEMPVLDGLETLTIIKEQYPTMPVIIISGTRDIDKATLSLNMGAKDFLSKPVSVDRLIVSIRNSMAMAGMEERVDRLQAQVENRFGFDRLIGHESGLHDAVSLAGKAAGSSAPVLITGETGVGKEVFARAIHGESARSGKPFIAVNCGAIPKNLVESTLFGHEKGSFTGAIQKTLGKFREAQGGTIFLDEIGELPSDAQVKLLRALQQKEVEPVGAAKPVAVDIRIISATNLPMEEQVKSGAFREDLFFRLNVLEVPIPPLRARVDDIPDLIDHFSRQFAVHEKMAAKTIEADAMQALLVHPWPGNVRELENTIQRAMILAEGESIGVGDLSLVTGGLQDRAAESEHPGPMMLSLLNPDGGIRSLKECEAAIIHAVLSFHKGNVTRAAKELGIAKSTLYRHLGAAD